MANPESVPLRSLNILELGGGVPGPFCTKLFAALGATVIKVEEPPRGDEARWREPFWKDTPGPQNGGLFVYLNGSKRSVALDLETTAGVGLLRRLVEGADVLVDGQPPGRMERLGLDDAALSRSYPGLIVTAIRPFGLTGPWKDFKGNELVSFHASGLGHLTPWCCEDPECPPLKGPGSLAELYAGLSAAVATIGAVWGRQATGRGGLIDISVQEAMLSILDEPLGWYNFVGEVASRMGSPAYAPRGVFPCKDGYVAIFAGQEHQWQRIVQLMGEPEWTKEEWAKNTRSRTAHRELLEAQLMEWTMSKTKAELEELARKYRATMTVANTFGEAVESRHLKERAYFAEVDNGLGQRFLTPGLPFRAEGLGADASGRAPLLGEHNEEVLGGGLGLSKQQLLRLTQAGVIWQSCCRE
ncbi:MAG: CoA transferase [Chloroflexi bacterium]|nr:CoA transferase [Chloroflexota bacterium]